MNKSEIERLLITNHKRFTATISSVPNEQFDLQPKGKWTTGQQLNHIIKSVKPVDMAFGLPVFVLKMKFGLANRPSKTYEGLVEKYLNSLKKNSDFEMPSDFSPDEITIEERGKALEKLNKLVQKLCKRLSKFSEEELDLYILPHPVMGKLTLREMLYFTIYHVQHHDKQILQNLNDYKHATES